MAKLHFYYSAMNAGKTTTLLQSNYNYHERGMTTLLFKPDFDDRVGKCVIGSRIGLKAEALTFGKSYDFSKEVETLLKASSRRVDCVLLDEAQFLTKLQVKQLSRVVDELNLPVLAYGLRSDFQGEPFPGSKYLLAWADVLIEIKTICFCGSKASMNLRVDQKGCPVGEGDQVEIGGNDRYVAVCRKHFHQCLETRACLGTFGELAA